MYIIKKKYPPPDSVEDSVVTEPSVVDAELPDFVVFVVESNSERVLVSAPVDSETKLVVVSMGNSVSE